MPVPSRKALQARISELEQQVVELNQVRTTLAGRTHDLSERIKELNCLYTISEIVDRPGRTLPQILEQTVDIIPRAWQYPEITCARISIDGQVFRSHPFRETAWVQQADIRIGGIRVGRVDVFYLEKRPEDFEEGPFSPEERRLITAVAERLGKIIERTRTIERLRENEERYRSLFTNNHAIMLLIDPFSGSIIDANPAACSFYGYTLEEFTGKKITDLNQLSSDRLFEEMASARTGVRHHFYFRHRLACGQVRDVEVYSGSIVINGRDLLYSIVHDITARKQAEQALRESKELLEKTFQSQQDAIFILNDESPPLILDCNVAAVKLFGYSRQEIIGRDMAFLCASRSEYDDFQQFMMTSSDSGVLHRSDFRMRRIEGKVFPTDNTVVPFQDRDGKRLGWVSVVRDMTRLRQAHRDLQEKEYLYRTLMESVKDGVMLVQDGLILFCNQAIGDMFRYASTKYLEGKRAAHLFIREERERLRPFFDAADAEEGGEDRERGICCCREGKQFWVAIHRNVIQWRMKKAILIALHDITEDVRREQAMALEAEQLRKENLRLRSSIRERYRFGDIIGKSGPMQAVYEQILQAAATDATVILTGESGTGKELVAQAIHRTSRRAGGQFVPVNCGAIPEGLFESEFFGHRKGAFTGAYTEKKGYFFAADNGTLFLDEVGEIDAAMQIKLLRAIETGEYTPIGDTLPAGSNVRIIAATNRELKELIRDRKFRKDFYYRINVLSIFLPPLRARKEDIPLLVEHFFTLYGNGKEETHLPSDLMGALFEYDWPGNVRELQSVIQRFLVSGTFHLERSVPGSTVPSQNDGISGTAYTLKQAVDRFECRYIEGVLEMTCGHKGKAAELLDVDPKTLYRKMKKAGQD